ncbi:beta-galactoside alpha-2,6-sialyltransferase (sialyltransferase 2) [Sarotherodon galilaeus]
MAAWFLIARFLLLYVLSDVDYSSAFPRATSPVQPRVWQGGRGEHDVYGNPRPFQYMRALRPTDPKIYPNVRDRVQVKSPRSYQPRSNIPTHRSMETSPLQDRAHRNHLVAKPRSFDLALRIPFAHSRDGANPPRYGPSGLIIDNSFNNPRRHHGHDASKLGYQFSLSVPFSHGSPRHPGGHEHHGGRQHRPEEDDLGHQREQVHVPVRPRPYPDEHHREHDREHRDEGRPGREFAFPEPDGPERPSRPRHPQRYVDPYSGYYNSQMKPTWNDYWWHYRGPHWGHVKHPSSDPWPNFHRSASD